MYDYKKSVKSDVSDELVNVYVLRPLAGLVVRLVYNTALTPNHLTVVSLLSGLSAAFLYSRGEASSTAFAGLCVTLKDILDSADGQLARVKKQYSRTGRFLDSIVDFVVDVAVFGAIGWDLFAVTGDPLMLVLSFVGLLGISLRVSYHVYYQTSFLHSQQEYLLNRLSEEIKAEDTQRGRVELGLQRVFQLIYGWQDSLIARIDRWCRGEQRREELPERWFSDRVGLRMSGLLGFGTELILLTVCSLFDRIHLYLYLNLLLMNGIWISSIAYRRIILAGQLRLR
jgi:archaetidylinositol phosphate synthase